MNTNWGKKNCKCRIKSVHIFTTGYKLVHRFSLLAKTVCHISRPPRLSVISYFLPSLLSTKNGSMPRLSAWLCFLLRVLAGRRIMQTHLAGRRIMQTDLAGRRIMPAPVMLDHWYSRLCYTPLAYKIFSGGGGGWVVDKVFVFSVYL